MGITDKNFCQNGGEDNVSQHGTVLAEIRGERIFGVAPELEMIAAAGIDSPTKRSLMMRKMFADLVTKDVRIVNISLSSGDIFKERKDVTEKWTYVWFPDTVEDLFFRSG